MRTATAVLARNVLRSLMLVGASAAFQLLPAPALGQARILRVHEALPNLDARTGTVQPGADQKGIVNALGASARWNRFGTPASLIRYGGYLASGLAGDAPTVARGWIRQNRALFRLSDEAVTDLELVSDSRMADYKAHAVIFRQRYGSLPAGFDGLITVGVVDGKVAYVSSSATGDGAAPGAPVLTAQQAWLKAAANVGRPSALGQISGVRSENGWTVFDVTGFAQAQRARLVALPTPKDGVRPAYETIVLHVQNGQATAYTVFVDAQSGGVLLRHNHTDRLANVTLASAALAPTTSAFTGTYNDDPDPRACGPDHPFDVPAGTVSIDVAATAAIPTNDIVLRLLFGAVEVANSDTGTSPEFIHYAPGVITQGIYVVRVCPFGSPTAPPVPPYNYAGTLTTNDVVQASLPYPPKWRFFLASPTLEYTNADIRTLACWVLTVGGSPVPGCQLALQNVAARAPWDHNFQTNTPTFTTIGNAAITAEAWGSPLTPAPPGQRPVDANREYVHPWTNVWFTSKCDPTNLIPGGNDILASVTHLFATHNRMHDYAYFLGFTEDNFNLQQNNFGNTQPGPYPLGRENDSEVGNVQAGAVTGGAPSYLGRDNANQITLFDGTPGITNQYLFQPIAGAFYSPCVDGDYDFSVVGHEFTHAISNRMVGGPDAGITSFQGGSMGESWSDLNALEYLHEFGYVPLSDENDWAEGPYVTNNKQAGIRNFGLNANPLNYGDIGYGTPGPEVHDDGEVWNAVNYEIRTLLVTKYKKSFPATNAALQKDCADGKRPADLCPGNRRWIQIMHDAFLLEQPALSMLDARDAYLAADVMRLGANQKDLWLGFARHGMGEFASTLSGEDEDPVPNFESPLEPNEANLTFQTVSTDGGPAPKAKIYASRFERGITPIADTDLSTALGDNAKFVPGLYNFVVQADGFGLFRFTRKLVAGRTETLQISLPKNLASMHNGATVTGDGTDLNNLIDDTEGTQWSRTGTVPNVNGSQVTVKLAGTGSVMANNAGAGPKRFNNAVVSAMLNPGQSRFSALRSFEIQACTASTLDPNCTNPLNFTTIYTSAPDFFPGIAPRPGAPDLIFRSFQVPATTATHVRLKVLTNQCMGGPDFAGEQDNDPLNDTDCQLGSDTDETVYAAELEVFNHFAGVGQPVALTATAPPTAAPGSTFEYEITYDNAGPAASKGTKITTTLPAEVNFVSATGGGTYDAATRKVTWKLGTVPVDGSGSVGVKVKVPAGTPFGTAIVNEAQLTNSLTVSPITSVAATTVLPLP